VYNLICNPFVLCCAWIFVFPSSHAAIARFHSARSDVSTAVSLLRVHPLISRDLIGLGGRFEWNYIPECLKTVTFSTRYEVSFHKGNSELKADEFQ